jgi:hypothetical protein
LSGGSKAKKKPTKHLLGCSEEREGTGCSEVKCARSLLLNVYFARIIISKPGGTDNL